MVSGRHIGFFVGVGGGGGRKRNLFAGHRISEVRLLRLLKYLYLTAGLKSGKFVVPLFFKFLLLSVDLSCLSFRIVGV